MASSGRGVLFSIMFEQRRSDVRLTWQFDGGNFNFTSLLLLQLLHPYRVVKH